MKLSGDVTQALAPLVVAEMAGVSVSFETAATETLALDTSGGVLRGGAKTIAFHLARSYPASGLLPTKAVLAAQVDAWADAAYTELVSSVFAAKLNASAPLLRTLLNMGVTRSAKQQTILGELVASADAAFHTLAALNTHLSTVAESRHHLVGTSVTVADIVFAARAYDVFRLIVSSDPAIAARYPAAVEWFDATQALPAFQAVLARQGLLIGGAVRVGGQIDVRPNPSRVSREADISIGRNSGVKKVESQRQKEKAAKEKARKKEEAVAAAKKKNNNNAAAATGAGAGSAAVTTSGPELSFGAAAGPARVTDVLSQMGLPAPALEESPKLDVERPVGHTTHNLFVKDKKSKKLFLVTVLQDAKLNLKAVAKTVGTKELRLASGADKALGVEKGCITTLSMVNDDAGAVTMVWDDRLAAFGDKPIRVCAFCSDPRDHSQHQVVDLTASQLLHIVTRGGTREAPTMISVE